MPARGVAEAIPKASEMALASSAESMGVIAPLMKR
ncbi:hypothetical protein FRIGORI9N_400114 [Frigoribacterium sp. 9N]|nr:hypothetical protein FRIGORI9N_400114 [Frigoribacterium sp. 9N]